MRTNCLVLPLRDVSFVSRLSRRCGSSLAVQPQQTTYIDEWFSSTRKPQKFYDNLAASDVKNKKYFYSIDLQGRVFLEEVLPKNIATSLKNTAFLDILFRQLRRVNAEEERFLAKCGAAQEYPFVSPCGIEKNFIRPADCPIVFHELKTSAIRSDEEASQSTTKKELIFGGSLMQPFYPSALAISQRSGRLYHRLIMEHDETGRKRQTKAPTQLHKISDVPMYGLIKSSVAVSIAEHFVETEELALKSGGGNTSGMDYECPEEGVAYSVSWLPAHAEPGPWSFPHSHDGGLNH
jgi:hypothetical protein